MYAFSMFLKLYNPTYDPSKSLGTEKMTSNSNSVRGKTVQVVRPYRIPSATNLNNVNKPLFPCSELQLWLLRESQSSLVLKAKIFT